VSENATSERQVIVSKVPAGGVGNKKGARWVAHISNKRVFF